MSFIKNNNNNNEHTIVSMTVFDGDKDHKSKILSLKGPKDQNQGYLCHKSPKHKQNEQL